VLNDWELALDADEVMGWWQRLQSYYGDAETRPVCPPDEL
jgi:hypothetical protein